MIIVDDNNGVTAIQPIGNKPALREIDDSLMPPLIKTVRVEVVMQGGEKRSVSLDIDHSNIKFAGLISCIEEQTNLLGEMLAMEIAKEYENV